MDGLDEWDELCNAARCTPGEFQCRDEGNCIPQDWTCDGHSDCTDGSDETVCNVTCSEEEFQCDNSDCIQAGSYLIDIYYNRKLQLEFHIRAILAIDICRPPLRLLTDACK